MGVGLAGHKSRALSLQTLSCGKEGVAKENISIGAVVSLCVYLFYKDGSEENVASELYHQP